MKLCWLGIHKWEHKEWRSFILDKVVIKGSRCLKCNNRKMTELVHEVWGAEPEVRREALKWIYGKGAL